MGKQQAADGSARAMPPESRTFTLAYRAAAQDGGGVLAYSQRVTARLAGRVRFDSADERLSSTDYLAVSCLGDVIEALAGAARSAGADLEEAEGTAKLDVSEPLTLVGVKGYEGVPRVEAVRMRVYACIDCDKVEFDRLCEQALRMAPVFQAVRRACDFKVVFSQVL